MPLEWSIVVAGEDISAGMAVGISRDARGNERAYRCTASTPPVFVTPVSLNPGDVVTYKPATGDVLDVKPGAGKIEVTVPPSTYRAGSAEQQLWELMGGLIRGACVQLGPETAYSVILSRVCRELRRDYGAGVSKEILETLAGVQHEAAAGDR